MAGWPWPLNGPTSIPDEAWHAEHVTEFLASSREAERRDKQDKLDQERRLADAEHRRAEEAEARKQEAEAAAGHQKKLSRRFLNAAAVAFLLAVAAGLATWRANLATGEARTSAEAAKRSEKRERA